MSTVPPYASRWEYWWRITIGGDNDYYRNRSVCFGNTSQNTHSPASYLQQVLLSEHGDILKEVVSPFSFLMLIYDEEDDIFRMTMASWWWWWWYLMTMTIFWRGRNFSGTVIGGFDPGYFAGTRAAGGYSYIKIMHERHYRDSRDNIAHPLFKMMVKKMIYI